MHDIMLDEALDLFKLPRELGETAEGEPVSANIGRFGPYVRYDNKFVSIRGEDPYTITLERALELIAEKKIADANRIIKEFSDAGIQVLRGRYGPYVTDGKKNAKIPKDTEPQTLTLAECEEMLAAAPERRARGSKTKKKKKKKKAGTKSTPAKRAAQRKKTAAKRNSGAPSSHN